MRGNAEQVARHVGHGLKVGSIHADLDHVALNIHPQVLASRSGELKHKTVEAEVGAQVNLQEGIGGRGAPLIRGTAFGAAVECLVRRVSRIARHTASYWTSRCGAIESQVQGNRRPTL